MHNTHQTRTSSLQRITKQNQKHIPVTPPFQPPPFATKQPIRHQPPNTPVLSALSVRRRAVHAGPRLLPGAAQTRALHQLHGRHRQLRGGRDAYAGCDLDHAGWAARRGGGFWV